MLVWAARGPFIHSAKEKLMLAKDVAMNISMKWFIVALAAFACYFLGPALKHYAIDFVKFSAGIERRPCYSPVIVVVINRGIIDRDYDGEKKVTTSDWFKQENSCDIPEELAAHIKQELLNGVSGKSDLFHTDRDTN